MKSSEATPCEERLPLSAASWPAVVEAMLDPVYRFVQARVPADAVDDLVQETFMAASAAFRRFDGRSSLWTWLTVIARHKIADWYRSRGRRHVLTMALDALDRDGAPIEEALASESPLPNEICERHEYQLLARAAVSALCPEDQACLGARYDDDLSLDELAARLGVTKAAANTRLYRARQELKAAFARLLRCKGELEQESVR
jgi:RNA polymerase sigma-70 factor (ECF subfamily)